MKPRISSKSTLHSLLLVVALLMCLKGSSCVDFILDKLNVLISGLSSAKDAAIIGNVGYYSANNKLYFRPLDSYSTLPAVVDITPSTLDQNYVLVPLPELDELIAIG